MRRKLLNLFVSQINTCIWGRLGAPGRRGGWRGWPDCRWRSSLVAPIPPWHEEETSSYHHVASIKVVVVVVTLPSSQFSTCHSLTFTFTFTFPQAGLILGCFSLFQGEKSLPLIAFLYERNEGWGSRHARQKVATHTLSAIILFVVFFPFNPALTKLSRRKERSKQSRRRQNCTFLFLLLRFV